jgi:uncharacterized membrane protein
MIDVLDWILVAIRWFHALAAMAWVGGGAFHLLVLRPASRRLSTGNPDADRTIAEEFKGVVNTAIAVLIISGVVLSLSRLTSDAVSLPYIGVLAGKITLAMYMFYIIWSMQRRRGLRGQRVDEPAAEGFWPTWRSRLTGTTSIFVCGVVVFGLADVLDALFERGLMG